VYLYVIDVTIPPLALPMADPLTAGLDQCMDGESFQPLCSAAIDGVVGYGGFTNLGGGLGMVYVYSEIFGPEPCGTILAEAEVDTVLDIVSQSPSASIAGCEINCPASFQEQFALVTSAPEPASMRLVGSALLLFAASVPISAKKYAASAGLCSKG
jgi:hypothetical protein